MSTTTSYRTIELSPALEGVHLDAFYREELTLDEDSAFDAYVQDLTRNGFYVIDSSLIVDIESVPPVSGWVLYRREGATASS